MDADRASENARAHDSSWSWFGGRFVGPVYELHPLNAQAAQRMHEDLFRWVLTLSLRLTAVTAIVFCILAYYQSFITHRHVPSTFAITIAVPVVAVGGGTLALLANRLHLALAITTATKVVGICLVTWLNREPAFFVFALIPLVAPAIVLTTRRLLVVFLATHLAFLTSVALIPQLSTVPGSWWSVVVSTDLILVGYIFLGRALRKLIDDFATVMTEREHTATERAHLEREALIQRTRLEERQRALEENARRLLETQQDLHQLGSFIQKAGTLLKDSSYLDNATTITRQLVKKTLQLQTYLNAMFDEAKSHRMPDPTAYGTLYVDQIVCEMQPHLARFAGLLADDPTAAPFRVTIDCHTEGAVIYGRENELERMLEYLVLYSNRTRAHHLTFHIRRESHAVVLHAHDDGQAITPPRPTAPALSPQDVGSTEIYGVVANAHAFRGTVTVDHSAVGLSIRITFPLAQTLREASASPVTS